MIGDRIPLKTSEAEENLEGILPENMEKMTPWEIEEIKIEAKLKETVDR